MSEINDMIEGANLEAPRLTPEHIFSVIKDVEFIYRPESALTICVMTLRNGFNVIGHSAAASPENYRQDIGEVVARKNAFEKIWQLEGYLLKEKLYLASQEADSTE
jgi:hypothetical protein